MCISCVDLECIIEKNDGWKNNPDDSSTIKLMEHIPPGFIISTISLFRSLKNKHHVYLKGARNKNH